MENPKSVSGGLIRRLDPSSNKPVYIGEAPPGTPDDSSNWKIKRLTYIGDDITEELYADGSSEMKFNWLRRATYQYK